MVRSAIFGALAAVGVPTLLRPVEGGLGDFVRTHSLRFEMAGIWFSWSWAIFAVVTLLTFLLLQVSRD